MRRNRSMILFITYFILLFAAYGESNSLFDNQQAVANVNERIESIISQNVLQAAFNPSLFTAKAYIQAIKEEGYDPDSTISFALNRLVNADVNKMREDGANPLYELMVINFANGILVNMIDVVCPDKQFEEAIALFSAVNQALIRKQLQRPSPDDKKIMIQTMANNFEKAELAFWSFIRSKLPSDLNAVNAFNFTFGGTGLDTEFSIMPEILGQNVAGKSCFLYDDTALNIERYSGLMFAEQEIQRKGLGKNTDAVQNQKNEGVKQPKKGGFLKSLGDGLVKALDDQSGASSANTSEREERSIPGRDEIATLFAVNGVSAEVFQKAQKYSQYCAEQLRTPMDRNAIIFSAESENGLNVNDEIAIMIATVWGACPDIPFDGALRNIFSSAKGQFAAGLLYKITQEISDSSAVRAEEVINKYSTKYPGAKNVSYKNSYGYDINGFIVDVDGHGFIVDENYGEVEITDLTVLSRAIKLMAEGYDQAIEKQNAKKSGALDAL